MIIEFSVLDTPDYSVEHLLDSPENEGLISHFETANNTQGLEDYLKIQAVVDERNNNGRTYLVKDIITGELMGYFSLRTGLITIQIYWCECTLYLCTSRRKIDRAL